MQNVQLFMINYCNWKKSQDCNMLYDNLASLNKKYNILVDWDLDCPWFWRMWPSVWLPCLKGTFLSSFTHHPLVQRLFELVYSANPKRRSFKECCKPAAIDLHSLYCSNYGCQWLPASKTLQKILPGVQQKKELHKGLMASKFSLWVNYP